MGEGGRRMWEGEHVLHMSNRGSKYESCPCREMLHSFQGPVMKKRWRSWGGGWGQGE